MNTRVIIHLNNQISNMAHFSDRGNGKKRRAITKKIAQKNPKV